MNIICKLCNKMGFVVQPPKPGFNYSENTPCPDCKGKGTIEASDVAPSAPIDPEITDVATSTEPVVVDPAPADPVADPVAPETIQQAETVIPAEPVAPEVLG